jgi:hypothetical protein
VNAYSTRASACSDSAWPRFHHDNASSGDYQRDATLPGAPFDAAVKGGSIIFKAPGDDLLCGRADRYQVATAGHPIDEESFGAADRLGGAPNPKAPGTSQTYAPPADAKRYVAIRAVDEDGNVGRVVDLDLGSSGAGNPGTVITKSKRNSKRHLAKFRFRGKKGTPPYHFECKLLHPKKRTHPKKPFHRCGSPRLYKHVKSGHWMFKVRAIDSAGNTDPSPAKHKFRIRRQHRNR